MLKAYLDSREYWTYSRKDKFIVAQELRLA